MAMIPGDGEKYCSLFGLYVLHPGIFSILETNIAQNKKQAGEFQLTTALEELQKQEGFSGLLMNGQNFDVGIPAEYQRTFLAFSATRSNENG